MKKIIIILLVLFICGLIIGCTQKKTTIIIPSNGNDYTTSNIIGPIKSAPPAIKVVIRPNLTRNNITYILRYLKNSTQTNPIPEITQPIYINITTNKSAPKLLNVTNSTHIHSRPIPTH